MIKSLYPEIGYNESVLSRVIWILSESLTIEGKTTSDDADVITCQSGFEHLKRLTELSPIHAITNTFSNVKQPYLEGFLSISYKTTT